jgi:receptor protein-tyrosine kinase
VIAAYDPFSAEVEALRALRTQLLLRLAHEERRRSRIAIISPQSGDGRSYLAANLAVVFSQLGERTLLVDADLRRPNQHLLFGLENRMGLSAMLSGRCGYEAIQRVPALANLSLLTSGSIPPNPQELLGRSIFAQLLDRMSSEFSVVIIDTPPGNSHAESLTIAGRAGSAVVVARRNVSRLNGVRDMAQSLSHAHVALVGAVLNEF